MSDAESDNLLSFLIAYPIAVWCWLVALLRKMVTLTPGVKTLTGNPDQSAVVANFLSSPTMPIPKYIDNFISGLLIDPIGA